MTERRNTQETSREWRARIARETEGMGRPIDVINHLKADTEKNGLPPIPTLKEHRQDAWELLRDYRAGEPTAVSRVRAVLRQVEPERDVTLQRVQHVIAVESKFANWGELKRAKAPACVTLQCPDCQHRLSFSTPAGLLFLVLDGPPECPECHSEKLMEEVEDDRDED